MGILRRLVLLVAACIVALLLVEFGLRLAFDVRRGTPYVAENPHTVYFNRPDISGIDHSPGEFHVAFHTNSRGLRSPETDYARGASARILCLGDSFTFGVGVGDDHTWPRQLDGLLDAELGRDVETVNAGVQGWGLVEYLIWYEREGRRYRPDLVIVGVHASDWKNALNGLVTRSADGELQRHQVVREDVKRLKRIAAVIPLYETLMAHSALAGMLKHSVVALTRQGTNLPVTEYRLRVERFRESYSLNRAILAELAAQVERSGARLLLLYIPKYQALKPGDPDGASHLFAAAVRDWSRELELPLVDMTPILARILEREARSVSELYHLRDGHCTELGYTAIARAAAAHVRDYPELLGATVAARSE